MVLAWRWCPTPVPVVPLLAAGAQLFAPGERMDGAFTTVARCLSRGFLWDNVRGYK